MTTRATKYCGSESGRVLQQRPQLPDCCYLALAEVSIVLELWTFLDQFHHGSLRQPKVTPQHCLPVSLEAHQTLLENRGKQCALDGDEQNVLNGSTLEGSHFEQQVSTAMDG
ncbi:hypothetical protein E2C01_013343 [Portunus trituberculatus]|uniref:Uncharacterized protein n=1 Tax=Portunus trituberculatus TaxID=210409 RepID=A0A5B7DFZ8_PORTR|nr:hypothetical protein [Portunus trituberculatus]